MKILCKGEWASELELMVPETQIGLKLPACWARIARMGLLSPYMKVVN